MSSQPHSTEHHGGPASPGAESLPTIDLVAGDPPVPITVWRTARRGDDQATALPARLAYRLIAAYSRPGEAVVDLTDGHALTAACLAGGRRHHRGWFTDASSLIIGPDTPAPTADDDPAGDSPRGHVLGPVALGHATGHLAGRGGHIAGHRAGRGGHAVGRAGHGAAESATDMASGDRTDETANDMADDAVGHVAGHAARTVAMPPDLVAWFGDDLTDDLTGDGGESVAPLPATGTVRGATSLLVACWPLDPDGEAANRVRLAWLLAAGAELLRPGGCLVLVATVPSGAHATPEDFGPLVAAASAAGLGYLQHIVAVTADTDGDQFVYHVTDEELLAIAGATDRSWAVTHVRVHADLLVFARSQGRPSGAARGDAHG
jgi:hypothetical protein